MAFEVNNLSEFLGNEKNIQIARNWFTDKELRKNVLLISGISGSGKNTLARLLCTEFGHNLCIVDGMQTNTEKNIIHQCEETLYSQSLNNNLPKCLLIDNIDTVMKAYKKILPEFIGFIKENRKYLRPIIITTTLDASKKITDLKKYATLIELNEPTKEQVVKFLSEKTKKINCKISLKNLNFLVAQTKKDLRRTILILEQLCNNPNGNITDVQISKLLESFSEKDAIQEDISLFHLCEKIFYKPSSIEDRIVIHDTEKKLLPLIIQQNAPDFIDNIDDMVRVSEDFSSYDIVENQIQEQQLWELFHIHGAFGVVAPTHYLPMPPLSKKKIQFTQVLTKLSAQTARKNAIRRTILHYFERVKENRYLATSEEKKLMTHNLFYKPMEFLEGLYFLLINSEIPKRAEILNSFGLTFQDYETIIKLFDFSEEYKLDNNSKKILRKLINTAANNADQNQG